MENVSNIIQDEITTVFSCFVTEASKEALNVVTYAVLVCVLV